MNEQHFLSAGQLTKAYKNRTISPANYLETLIERVEQINPEVNAVVLKNYDQARSRALEAEKALGQGEWWGPLHGVPITIKDNLEVEGLTCSAGSELFREYIAKRNADAVQPLLDAGAIVLGKTNLPAFAADFQTYNELYGQTNNPWNLETTPGGSSGGSAASLACGFSVLEVGNDIGGSIRHPANFCGVYGHRPSVGIIPDRGRLPALVDPVSCDYPVQEDLIANGPLARYPEDLELALDLMARPANPDRKAWSIRLPPSRREKLSQFRVGLWLDESVCPIADSVKNRIRRVAGALENSGVKIEEKHPDIDFSKGYDLFIELLNAVMSLTATPEIFGKWLAKESQLDEQAEDYQTKQMKAALQRHRDWRMKDVQRQLLRQKWAEYFETFDVLLCPVTPVPAFPHDHGNWFRRTIEINGDRYPYSDLMVWAGLTSLTYLPSTVAPIGITSKGLPIGIQIIGPYLEDKTTLHFAKLLGDLVGGFTPPPSYLH